MSEKEVNYKTNFQKVQEFNRAFDMVPANPKNYDVFYCDKLGRVKVDPLLRCRLDIFEKERSVVCLRLDLIKEEVTELLDAINAEDIIEQRDACADILYVVYGMADVLGIEIDNIFRANIESEYFAASKYTPAKNEYCNGNLAFVEYIKKVAAAINDETGMITNFSYLKNFQEIFGFNRHGEEFECECLQPDNFSHVPMKLEDKKKSISASIKIVCDDLERACYRNLWNYRDGDRDDILMNKFEAIGHHLYKLLKYTYYYVILLGYDADKDFAIVHDSNMSKLCSSELEAKQTVADYAAKYASGSSPYDSPYYYYLKDLNKWIIKNKSTGKALKNINYIKVKFD